MIAKDTTTVKVLTSKLVRKVVNGVKAVDSDGKPVYDRVPYYRTVTVNPPLAGAVGTFTQSAWTATSQLTLYAVPKA